MPKVCVTGPKICVWASSKRWIGPRANKKKKRANNIFALFTIGKHPLLI